MKKLKESLLFNKNNKFFLFVFTIIIIIYFFIAFMVIAFPAINASIYFNPAYQPTRNYKSMVEYANTPFNMPSFTNTYNANSTDHYSNTNAALNNSYNISFPQNYIYSSNLYLNNNAYDWIDGDANHNNTKPYINKVIENGNYDYGNSINSFLTDNDHRNLLPTFNTFDPFLPAFPKNSNINDNFKFNNLNLINNNYLASHLPGFYYANENTIYDNFLKFFLSSRIDKNSLFYNSKKNVTLYDKVISTFSFYMKKWSEFATLNKNNFDYINSESSFEYSPTLQSNDNDTKFWINPNPDSPSDFFNDAKENNSVNNTFIFLAKTLNNLSYINSIALTSNFISALKMYSNFFSLSRDKIFLLAEIMGLKCKLVKNADGSINYEKSIIYGGVNKKTNLKSVADIFNNGIANNLPSYLRLKYFNNNLKLGYNLVPFNKDHNAKFTYLDGGFVDKLNNHKLKQTNIWGINGNLISDTNLNNNVPSIYNGKQLFFGDINKTFSKRYHFKTNDLITYSYQKPVVYIYKMYLNNNKIESWPANPNRFFVWNDLLHNNPANLNNLASVQQSLGGWYYNIPSYYQNNVLNQDNVDGENWNNPNIYKAPYKLESISYLNANYNKYIKDNLNWKKEMANIFPDANGDIASYGMAIKYEPETFYIRVKKIINNMYYKPIIYCNKSQIDKLNWSNIVNNSNDNSFFNAKLSDLGEPEDANWFLGYNKLHDYTSVGMGGKLQNGLIQTNFAKNLSDSFGFAPSYYDDNDKIAFLKKNKFKTNLNYSGNFDLTIHNMYSFSSFTKEVSKGISLYFKIVSVALIGVIFFMIAIFFLIFKITVSKNIPQITILKALGYRSSQIFYKISFIYSILILFAILFTLIIGTLFIDIFLHKIFNNFFNLLIEPHLVIYCTFSLFLFFLFSWMIITVINYFLIAKTKLNIHKLK